MCCSKHVPDESASWSEADANLISHFLRCDARPANTATHPGRLPRHDHLCLSAGRPFRPSPRRRGRGRVPRAGLEVDVIGFGPEGTRCWLARHVIKAVIPRRKDQRPDDKRMRFDKEAYRRRSVVERCIGWLKESRAVATRFDKLAMNYLATVQWAMVQRYLRLLTT